MRAAVALSCHAPCGAWAAPRAAPLTHYVSHIMKTRLNPNFFAAMTISVLIIGILLFVSRQKALKTANDLMAPALDKWAYMGTHFLPIGFLGVKDGPSWWISYDAKEELVVGPLSVQVNLIGEVIGTNPVDLRERLTRYREPANQNTESDGFDGN